MTKELFCDYEQKDTTHNLSVDLNNEILMECTTEECGHFIKFPAGLTPEEIDAKLVEYREANLGKVTAAELEASRAEQEGVLAALADETPEE
jgi:hypothetical protein